MKYILGVICIAIGISFYIKPDLLAENINIIFGVIFILLGNLFFNYKREDM